jgi:hypothetical protein
MTAKRSTRRDFLQATGVAATAIALPNVITSKAPGDATTPPGSSTCSGTR